MAKDLLDRPRVEVEERHGLQVPRQTIVRMRIGIREATIVRFQRASAQYLPNASYFPAQK